MNIVELKDKKISELTEMARDMGEIYPRAKGLYGSAICALQLDDRKEAEGLLYESLHYFKQLGLSEMVTRTETRLKDMIGET